MEPYQVAALAVMLVMAYVVHATLQLTNFRKKAGVRRAPINLRDLAVFRRPETFEAEEVRLVRKSWLACAALMLLFLLMLGVLPQDIVEQISTN
jgi:hypothetical protein